MHHRAKIRCSIALVTAGILLGAWGLLHTRLNDFQGDLFLARGQAENLVVAPTSPTPKTGIAYRNVVRDGLLFSNPGAAGHLDGYRRFDGALLEHAIRFDRLEILQERPDRHFLVVYGPAGEETHEIQSGDRVGAGERSIHVEDIAPWEGLIRHERGQAMATVTLDSGAGKELLFLGTGGWLYPQPDLAVRFQWYEDENEAEGAAPIDRQRLNTEARWGVREGDSVHWIQGLTRGSGLVRQDGSRFTLSGVAEDGAAILVQESTSDRMRTLRVPANENAETGSIYYQNPGQTRRILSISSWREDEATLRFMIGAASALSRSMHGGEEWLCEDGTRIGLGQVLPQAVPVTRETGRLQAAYLTLEGIRYTLREGIVHTLGETRLAYKRETRPPIASVHLSALERGGQIRNSVTILPGATFRLGVWDFSVSESSTPSQDGVILHARRRSSPIGIWLGALLLATGCAVLVATRFRPGNGAAG